jgi:zinc protease
MRTLPTMKAVFKYLILIAGALAVAAYASVNSSSGTIARATLGNGLRVVIVKNALAPAVTYHVDYLVGSNESPPGFPGTAHAVEHMMFRGSEGLSADQLNAIQTHVGGDANAFTHQTVTQYIATIPASDLETMLHVEAVRMRGILATEAQWRLECGAINQEVAQDLSNPMYCMYTQLNEKLFPGTPYAHDALGTVDSFERTTGDMLKKFHEDWYAPNNAVLVIVGDVDPTATLNMVKRLFDGIPAKKLPERSQAVLGPLKAAELTTKSHESYGMAVVAYRLPGINDKDYAAGQILTAALANPRGMLTELADEGGILETDFDCLPLPRATAGFAMAAVSAGEDLRSKAELLKKVIAENVKDGIPAELVEAVKRQAVTEVELDKESIPDLADAWSEAIAFEGFSSPDERLAAIKNVTAADVNRVAKAYLDNTTAITSLMEAGNSGGTVVVSKKLKRKKESFKPKTVNPVELPTWAQQVAHPPAVPCKIPIAADIRLANGLRLIVRTTGNSKIVTLYGHIENTPELQTPKGKEGVADILDELILHGTAGLSRLQYQTALDAIGATAVPGTDFSLVVMEKHFSDGVSLLADAILHPALSNQAFKEIKQQMAESAADQKNSQESQMGRRAYLEALHPKGDALLRSMTPETIKRLTVKDVKDYHASVFRPDMTTIVVTGNISPAKARTIVEKHFGGWQATGPKPEAYFKPVPGNKPVSILVADNSSQQDEVTLAQTTGLTRTHPDYYPFQLGLTILSGNPASRLYQSIREKRGLVYGVDAELSSDKTRSVFKLSYGTSPKNVATVRTLIEREIDDLRTTPVSQAELSLAKNSMLRQLALSGTASDSIAALLLDLSRSNLPLDQISVAARLIQEATPQQIQAALHKWIRPDGFVQVVVGPKPVNNGHKHRQN